jgi:small subunit ribosomal protein S17
MDKEQQLENLEKEQDLSTEQVSDVIENVSSSSVETDLVAEATEKSESYADNTASETTKTESDSITRTAVKKILQGKVTSNKADKTIVVAVERQVRHPLYKKYFKRTKKFMAHDPNNECGIGDVVRIKEHRPISKMKRWMLVEVVTKAK